MTLKANLTKLDPIAAIGIALTAGVTAVAISLLSDPITSALSHQTPKRLLAVIAGTFLGSCLQYAYEKGKNLNPRTKSLATATAALSIACCSAVFMHDTPQNTRIFLLSMVGIFAGSQASAWLKANKKPKHSSVKTKAATVKLNPVSKAASVAVVSSALYLPMMSALGSLSYKSAIPAFAVSLLGSAGYGVYAKGKNPSAKSHTP